MSMHKEVNTQDVALIESNVNDTYGENIKDSLEYKSKSHLIWFKSISRYGVFFLGFVIIILFGFRYLHLINSWEKIKDIYLQSNDWHIYIIYGISMAFTASMILTVFISLLKYLKTLSNK